MAAAIDSSKFLVSEAHLVLDATRKEQAKRIKTRGDPIQLPNNGLALAIKIQGDTVWIAENTGSVRAVNLEDGKTLAVYRGAHKAPVTCFEFFHPSEREEQVLISGSWDKAIVIWDIITKRPLSITPSAHGDFVKSILVLPNLQLLVSSGSDKIIRFWDLSSLAIDVPLRCAGTISAHTRPVECLAFDGGSILYTADTMGVIIAWSLTKESTSTSNGKWRVIATELQRFDHHRTRINDVWTGKGFLWTASSDETVQVSSYDTSALEVSAVTPPPKPLVIQHPVAARALLPLPLTALGEDEAPYVITAAGENLYIHELEFSHKEEDGKPPEATLLRKVDDVHWHEITSVRLWMKKERLPQGSVYASPWIVTSSLDGTVRKWNLGDLLKPKPVQEDIENKEDAVPSEPTPVQEEDQDFKLSEEEERELAELMDDDDD